MSPRFAAIMMFAATFAAFGCKDGSRELRCRYSSLGGASGSGTGAGGA